MFVLTRHVCVVTIHACTYIVRTCMSCMYKSGSYIIICSVDAGIFQLEHCSKFGAMMRNVLGICNGAFFCCSKIGAMLNFCSNAKFFISITTKSSVISKKQSIGMILLKFLSNRHPIGPFRMFFSTIACFVIHKFHIFD